MDVREVVAGTCMWVKAGVSVGIVGGSVFGGVCEWAVYVLTHFRR